MNDIDYNNYFPGLNSLFLVYDELDSLINTYHNGTGLNCSSGCDKCCLKPQENIEASVYELLPLGIHLWRNGKADDILKSIDGDNNEFCSLYNPSPGNEKGGCRYYCFRPLVCRLFGIYGFYNKFGVLKTSICKYIKPDNNVNSLCNKIENFPPVNTYFYQKISSLNPYLTANMYPINQAIKQAIEKTWIFNRLTSQNRNEILTTI